MLTRNRIYNVCVANNYCTHIGVEVYEKILDMPENGFTDMDIATVIWAVSDVESREEVLNKLTNDKYED